MPQAVIDSIDEICERWGYPSRDSFAQEAVREKIYRIRELEVALARVQQAPVAPKPPQK